MDSRREPTWPCFVLRRITLPPGVPEPARAALDERGVPERSLGGEYVGMDEAQFLPGRPHLLAFGRSRLRGRICLDLRSLEVVHVPVIGMAQVNPVNASVAAFVACVEAAIGRFPYYTYETAEDLDEQVAAELREKMVRIDPTADALNGLWETFLDDVAMGNYATEEFTHVSTSDDNS